MKQLLIIAAGLSLSTPAVYAQDVLFAQDMAKVKMQLEGAVMGQAVKGAPYSAEEVNSNTQVLADGTRIHRESKTTVYRDGEGRTRRETPDQITITDPVAGFSYFLNPKTMTAQKTHAITNFRTFRSVEDGNISQKVTASTVTMTTRDGETSMVINGNPVDPKMMAEAIAKAKQHGEGVVVSLPGEDDLKTVLDKTQRALQERISAEKAGPMVFEAKVKARANTEDLGKRTMEGVVAEGTRNTSTIDTDAIGNDRPIQVATERWYSPELQTVVMTKTTDPRMGEMSFQLTNLRRGEPGAYLFQVPAGYTVNQRK